MANLETQYPLTSSVLQFAFSAFLIRKVGPIGQIVGILKVTYNLHTSLFVSLKLYFYANAHTFTFIEALQLIYQVVSLHNSVAAHPRYIQVQRVPIAHAYEAMTPIAILNPTYQQYDA